MSFLSEEFLQQYPDAPEHMNELSSFVYYRTYSRWLPEKGRRETWKETCARAVEYNVGLGKKFLDDKSENRGGSKLWDLQDRYNHDWNVKEAQKLFDNMFNLKQFLSGRTLWVGGTEASKKYPLSNFNCAFVEITKWDDLCDLFYLLLIGTGVGFSCTKENASKLSALHLPQRIVHKEYAFIGENGKAGDMAWNGKDVTITIGDSKEGWVDAFRNFVWVLTISKTETVETLTLVYDLVRPKGERLKVFGGTASGHEPLKAMFQSIEKMLRGKLDTTTPAPIDGQVRPVHVLDIGNLIGNNVVCGGVRRTAEIFLCDADDWESILAKFGINGIWGEQGFKHLANIKAKMEELNVEVPAFFETLSVVDNSTGYPFNQTRTHLNHRRMSNNSIAFRKKPSKGMLELLFLIMRMEGEPGFVNLEEASRRRPNAKGLNPCVEIILDSYGVCNLTTVNVDAFVTDGKLDVEGLYTAQQLSARAGLRMTLAELEMEHWNHVQQRDRLLGTSLTGWCDAVAKITDENFDKNEVLKNLKMLANNTAEGYAKQLGVNKPLLVTTVKPEGTLSQVAGGVSSGLHFSHSPYYIRRIRINSHDPLAQVAKELGWTVSPEVGQQLETAQTLVIDFPIASGAIKSKDDVYVDEQIENYMDFQKYYSDHNSSNTIHVRDDEWEHMAEKIHSIWDDYVGVSFLAYDGGTYKLAPYEAITEEQYNELKGKMKPFDHKLLQKYERGEETDLEGMDGCEGGACPIR
jgi:ribonucleoside-diphosphate reductase alpha chain/ribonucleoside-triphosphate reductase